MKTAYIFFAEGFEEIEALTTVDVLRRAGVKAMMISVTADEIVRGAHGVSVLVDKTIDNVEFSEADMLILPGGMPGAANLAACLTLTKQLKAFAAAGKPYGAICAAPFVLGQLGLLKGKHATCYPGFEDQLEGAVVTGAMAEQDGNVITGKGPAAAAEFALKIAALLVGQAKADEVATGMLLK
ncbi:MAG: DJ-1/PfpI family protein [Bacteroidaceae bacterium]|nr:DJ-1/PfpI family protein [Bacteroidaceae bacterium]